MLYSVEQTTDGGYILAGWTEHYGWLIKTDPKGVMDWERNISSGLNTVQIRSVQETTDGGYILAGWLQSLDGGNRSSWLSKTGAKGFVEWEKTIPDTTELLFVRQSDDGGYIAVGGANGRVGTSEYYGRLIKTDAKGFVEWERTFGSQNCDLFLNQVQQTTDGGYIIAGSGNEENRRVGQLIKTDSKGITEWEKTFGGDLESVQETTDGGYIVAGGWSGLLIKTDSKGATKWERPFENVRLRSVDLTTDGGYIISGAKAFRSDGSSKEENDSLDNFEAWLIKTDSEGIMTWEKTFGDQYYYSELDSVDETKDGGYIVVGGSRFNEKRRMNGLLIKMRG